MSIRFVIAFAFAAMILPALAASDSKPAGAPLPPDEKPKPYGALKYRTIGPAVGGRVDRVTGVPGDPLTFYLAAAQGGIWKSENGGRDFKPVFDDQPNGNTGSIAVAASDHSVLYVGTGEANIRGNVSFGTGIFKSTDAGKSWKQVWTTHGQIGTIAIDPRNAEVAYAAVFGSPFGASKERGVYRTTDGGKNWQRVLFKDELTGASDVAIDPNRPHVLFAGLWQAKRYPWDLTSGGPGSGLYRSDDGGDTWKQISEHGLPLGEMGKIGVAISRTDSNRVYALIEAKDGGLFRSDDGGENWERASGARVLRQRMWYYTTLTIDPDNADIVWLPQVNLVKTVDGGKEFVSVKGLHHGDNHDVWIDPTDNRRMIVGNDGGVDLTNDGGKTWWSPSLPLAQFYNIDADDRIPYHVGGTMQDWGTSSGPAYVLRGNGAPLVADFYAVGGGEAGDFQFDRELPGHIYAGEYSGYISHYQELTGQFRNVTIYPHNMSGHGAIDGKYRFQWTAPIATSAYDPKVLYHGAQVLFKTSDRGVHWQAISGDLTRNDKSKQKWAGGPLTGDNTGVEVYDTIFSIAESPVAKDQIWVGTDDGLVQLTRDGGKNWQNVTPAKLPPWATVEGIEASRKDAGTAYVTVDARRLNDVHPYLFRTRDFGKSWEQLSKGLPEDQHLFVLREDPTDPNLLYVGAERGVFYSRDGGATFEDLRMNLPAIGVSDMRVKHDDLILGTRRSIWVLDDLSSLRAFVPSIRKEPVHLFKPRPAYRFRLDTRWDHDGATDPAPLGLIVDYWLRDKIKGEPQDDDKPVENAHKDDLKLEILDAQGKIVRTLSTNPRPPKYAKDDADEPPEDDAGTELTKEQGLNRIVWDLRYEGAKRLEKAKIDAGEPEKGILAAPGMYTLRLLVPGQAVVTTTAEIKPDPHSPVPAAELAQNVAFALRARDALDQLVDDIETIRAIREQAGIIKRMSADKAALKGVNAGAEVVIKHCDELDLKFHNPKAEVVYDVLAGRFGGAKLYSQIAPLYSDVQTSDYAPTQGQSSELDADLADKATLEGELSAFREGEVARFEEQLRAANLPRILTP
ncbi:MAG TPA: hypothetical protein VGH81_00670 [Rudaea sp.]|jgi:photosystem II stability/assembly factor-like uncharacterized protein